MSVAEFVPSASLTFSTVEAERRRLVQYCHRLNEESQIRLDLEGVTQCDSAGLAFLIETNALARQYGKLCQFSGVSDAIRALAAFCGVESMLVDVSDVTS